MPISLAPGQLINREFVVERPLSAGGMGAVFVVLQQSTGAKRALKVMHPAIVQDQQQRKRFELEARVAASIPSDHVVQLISAGVDEQSSLPFLVMELLVGENLAERIERQGGLDLGAFCSLFEQLCHALGAAHHLGIVHRDLKPENLFLAHSRAVGVPFMVKVLDFGIAKIIEETGTHRTQPMGTPLWMAPEQTTRDGRISPQTDVWALGLIAFYCLTGRSFWRSGRDPGSSLQQLLREMLLDDLVSPGEHAKELGARLPAGFDDWFQRCVQRDPRTRFRDARVAHEEFRRLVGMSPSPTAVPRTEPMIDIPAFSGPPQASTPERRTPRATPDRLADGSPFVRTGAARTDAESRAVSLPTGAPAIAVSGRVNPYWFVAAIAIGVVLLRFGVNAIVVAGGIVLAALYGLVPLVRSSPLFKGLHRRPTSIEAPQRDSAKSRLDGGVEAPEGRERLWRQRVSYIAGTLAVIVFVRSCLSAQRGEQERREAARAEEARKEGAIRAERELQEAVDQVDRVVRSLQGTRETSRTGAP